ncbi:DUF6915 family protein [Celeribacter sp.]|uniref:DUF6915 family protein n=1 Tax=Celeribacter sp. TaxID=1890673 RepID=UPI003A8F92CB
MAHPLHHAESSVRKFGGVPDDYQHVHDWFDTSEEHLAIFTHRAHQFDSLEAFLRDLADVSDQSDLSLDQLRERAHRKGGLLTVFFYNHFGFAMNTIGFHCPWDSGQVGYVYVTLEAVRKEFGAKRVTKALREKA